MARSETGHSQGGSAGDRPQPRGKRPATAKGKETGPSRRGSGPDGKLQVTGVFCVVIEGNGGRRGSRQRVPGTHKISVLNERGLGRIEAGRLSSPKLPPFAFREEVENLTLNAPAPPYGTEARFREADPVGGPGFGVKP